MNSKFLIFLIFSFFSSMLFAGNENFPSGGRQAAMADAGVALTDLWSVQHNQAGIAGLKKISAGINYETKYMLKDLGFRSGAFALPIKNSGVFGVYISDYGYKLYKEQKVGLSYAKTFGKIVSVGVQIDYLNTSIGEDYGKRSALAAEAGVIAKISSNLDFGAHIYNPNRAKLADYNDERSPTIMKMGFGYRFSEKIITLAEVEKNVDSKNVFKGGIEYNVVKAFSVRGGISSNPSLISFGFGLHLKNFRMDVAASMHQVLGYSPKLSLQYIF